MEKEMCIDVKNYVREKNGLYYAVMVYKNVRGERKKIIIYKYSEKNKEVNADGTKTHCMV